MSTLIYTGIGLSALFVGLLIIRYGYLRVMETYTEDRMQTLLGDQGHTQTNARRGIIAEIRSRELEGTLLERTLGNLFEKVLDFINRRTPAETIQEIDHKLEIAGNPFGITTRTFLGIQILLFSAGVVGAVFLLSSGPTIFNVVISVGLVLLVILAPIGWLQNRIGVRQQTILKDFPEAVEILSICTNAGLSFNQAMMRYSDLSQTVMGEEFARVVNEMEVGLSKREALRGLADRLEIDEVSSFVSIIIQSEQLGMSISSTLSALSEQMRTERYFRVKEEVQKIPIKMLVPLAFLIFPALIAIILGPSLPPLLELFDFI